LMDSGVRADDRSDVALDAVKACICLDEKIDLPRSGCASTEFGRGVAPVTPA